MTDGVPANRSIADTLVVRDGRVAFAGRRAEVNPARGGAVDRPRRARGAPGPRRRARSPDVPGAGAAHPRRPRPGSEEEIARRVGEAPPRAAARRVAQRPRLGSEPAGPAGRFPSRASLDRAAPDHPVALVRIDGHATWANSAALAAAGIDRDTPRSHRRPRRPATPAASPPASSSTPRSAWSNAWSRRRRTRGSTGRCATRSASAWPWASPASTRWAPTCYALAAYRRLVERGHFPLPQLRRGGRARRSRRGSTIASWGPRRSATAG